MILAIFAVLVVLFVVLPLVGMALWALVSTVVVGLVIGALGRLIVPGTQAIGFLATVGAGLCGSLVGGFVGQHVLHVHWLGTILLEVGIAAVLAAAIAGRQRQIGPGGHPRPIEPTGRR